MTEEVEAPAEEAVEEAMEEAPTPKLEMVLYPNKFLRFRAVPFTEDQIKSPLVKQVSKLMIEKMYELHGVGLAAQQVGIPQRIFVMDHQFMESGKKDPKVFLNPEIIFADMDTAIAMPPRS